ncbi:chemotaxis protein CheW [Bordetella bronchialis]|uniref:Chemotaxis protein CheW n=1 Tax=Bordetella bronchialis TaxID=463025 RepID=A0A193G6L8_9BORD|nr:chemotaxis protein CheW [Bordetella bronchialis]ANN69757.1 hypothetical protein BAU06_18120 [Bordetella bronchialis]ANN74899.1 hypothetical protein BAU08_18345 [Bordetella bronchialis]
MPERDSVPVDDCWNRIGVRGDRSCARLREYVHCRQCPVYATAGQRLLHRLAASVASGDVTHDAPAAVPAQADSRAADEASGAEPATSLLVFRLHAEWLALPVAALAEVTPPRPIHGLPRRAGIVLGVCNVRGRLVPCISLAALLELAPPPAATGDHRPAGRMLVMSTHTGPIVIPVDEVAGIQSYPARAIGPVPDTLAGARLAAGVVRYRDRAVGLLDSARIAQAVGGRLA